MSLFHVLRARSRFQRYRGRWVPFSCFALPDSFSAVPKASCAVLMYCRSGLVFGGTEGVGSRFHVLRAQTHFRRYRGCRLPFSCFARPDSFLAVPWESDPVLMSCAPVLVFSCIEGVGPVFMFCAPRHVSSVPRASGPVIMFCAPGLFFGGTDGVGRDLMFCAPGLIFGGTDGVGSRSHVLHAHTLFRRYRGCQVPFSCFACPD
jgi:hypothetical protein